MTLETLITPIEIIHETKGGYKIIHPRVVFNTTKDISALTNKRNLTEEEVLQIQRVYKFSTINIPKQHAHAVNFQLTKVSKIYARRLCLLTEESVELAHNNYEYANQFFTQIYNKAKHYKLEVTKKRHLTYIYKLVKEKEKR
ncbi:MAG: hypothetical protein HUJ68_10180 [Clostridia bacterium]|nr:hypothetical protein [Clostridia bacterium]